MNGQINITESEWKVMKVLWGKSPLELKDIAAKLRTETHWRNPTVRTLLLRLIDKEAVKADKTTGIFKYSSKIPESDCVKVETKSFLERVYDGSVSQFVSFMAKEGEISEKECREIMDIIANMKGGEDD